MGIRIRTINLLQCGNIFSNSFSGFNSVYRSTTSSKYPVPVVKPMIPAVYPLHLLN